MSNQKPVKIIILAAGKGTRMKSTLPKVLHPIANKPILAHVVDTASELSLENISVVIGYGAEQVKNALKNDYPTLNYVQQREQLGTGHAVKQALPDLAEDQPVLILYGDVPLIQEETLNRLLERVSENSMGLLTVILDDPHGYGRIIRDDDNAVTSIVEQRDASMAQKEIREINTGIMAIMGKHLIRWVNALNNDNAQGEYYLTDIIAMAAAENVKVMPLIATREEEVLGINDHCQQAQLERSFQRHMAENLMRSGLTLMDPARFDCRGTLIAGSDCVVDINCVFEGEVRLGNKVRIEANCQLKNTKVGDNCVIKSNSVLENSEVDANCEVGPFARLRIGTKLSEGAKIGNFVETKNAHIGRGTKANHLSYVGDAQVGSQVNIGAGTITCNYDGANKHQTVIEDEVFVGSNTALIAPVTLGKHSTIGAGSTITQDVDNEKLALARSKQRQISAWTRPSKKQ